MDIPLKQLDGWISPITSQMREIKHLEKYIREKINNKCFDDSLFKRGCQLITKYRRLLKHQYQNNAWEYCNDLQNILNEYSPRISFETLSWFFYEQAFLFMIKYPNPDLNLAVDFFEKSCQYAKKGNNSNNWAISRLESVHAQFLAYPKLKKSDYNRFSKIQQDCFDILCKQRWKMSPFMHRAYLQLKAHMPDDAAMTLKRARELRNNLNVVTGWTLFQTINFNFVEGLIAAQKKDYYQALRLLTLAVKPMGAARGKKPERYKDIAKCSSWILEGMGHISEASQIRAIEKLMIDGRSGIWVDP